MPRDLGTVDATPPPPFNKKPPLPPYGALLLDTLPKRRKSAYSAQSEETTFSKGVRTGQAKSAYNGQGEQSASAKSWASVGQGDGSMSPKDLDCNRKESNSPKGFKFRRQFTPGSDINDGRKANHDANVRDKIQEPPIEQEEDPFLLKMRAVMAEHIMQLSEIMQENQALKTKLNSVLQATWDFTSEEWHGHPHRPSHAELYLMTKDRKDATWMVPKDFLDPKQKVEVEPDTFALRDSWVQKDEQDDNEEEAVRKSIGSASGSGVVKRLSALGGDIQFETESEASKHTLTVGSNAGCHGSMIIHPSSAKRFAWDIVCMCMLIYDVVMVPIGAFSPKDTAFTIFMDWCTLLFWTIDMVATCCTGFNSKGVTIMEPRLILFNYGKTWLPLDIIIVVPDWIHTIFRLTDDNAAASGSFTRLLRSFRMARALRLLRLAKLKRILTVVKDLIQSELVFKAVSVAQIVSALVFANHLICSVWYLIGTQWDDNWIDKARIQDEPLAYRYFTSLQWSLSFFTLGTIRLEAQNTFERFFAIVLMTSGMMFFVSFTSYVTVALLQATNNRKDVSTQLWLLRRYLRQEKVPAMLSYRVLRSAEYACTNRKEVLEEGHVSVLEYLSEALRAELKYEAYFSAVGCHPMFELALSISQKTIHRLAEDAMTRKTLASKETLFKRGFWCPHMYVVASGALFYGRAQERVFKLAYGQWICEHTLWVRWMSRGIAKAARVGCTVIQIDEKRFSEAIQLDEELFTMMQKYAANFAKYLNGMDIETVLDIWPEGEAVRRAERFIVGGS